MQRFCLALLTVSSFSALHLQAAAMTFFGEDTTGSAMTRATNINAMAARTLFLSNFSSSSTNDLESLMSGSLAPFTISISNINATVSGGNAAVRSLASGTDRFGEYPTSGTTYIASDSSAALTFTFSSPITSFGFYATDVGDFSNGTHLTVSFTGASGTNPVAVNNVVTPSGTSGQNSVADGSLLFFGYINTAAAFTSVQILSPSDSFGFDDPTIGVSSITATPEPSTVFLIAAGLVVLSARRLKFFKFQA